ncbi:MAG: DUF2117 domain-containing protein [Methanosarcina sp.]|nr:DUF2117 domain-containing protein [Methanosarcina sp.]MDD3874529.1 DUF2117 domain-containing protein [Methanosarcina sp.]MDD4522453.1 DUF2117 domain-containing protein [Methanosarcina sp.]
MFLPSNVLEMKISLVIHGPEVIDSGEAKKVLEKLSCAGKVEARLGGAMGKIAVLDAGLENLIDISRHQKPSACIESLFETSDLVCLLNRGKTIETGKAFGEMVAARLREPERKPLIQIESPENADGKLIPLNKKAGEYLENLSKILGLPAESPLPLRKPVLQNSVFVEKCLATGKIQVIRKLSGVFPGEKILVNGIVIGNALFSEVSVVSENGFIVAIEGGEIKEHGLEKLHNYENRDPVDLTKAWVKSGNLRRSNFFLLQAQKQRACGRDSGFSSRPGAGKVVLIDHAAEYTFELAADAELAVTVGDDTTAIAGDILFRLGIPILGITDGDCDRLACWTEIFPGSVVLRLTAGNDDILGKKLKQELLGGENSADLKDICAFKEDVIKLAEPLIEAIFEY